MISWVSGIGGVGPSDSHDNIATACATARFLLNWNKIPLGKVKKIIKKQPGNSAGAAGFFFDLDQV